MKKKNLKEKKIGKNKIKIEEDNDRHGEENRTKLKKTKRKMMNK